LIGIKGERAMKIPDETTMHGAREFFVARQPILHPDHSLFAYELLFRSAASGPANVTDDRIATASVIMRTADLGFANVVGEATAFLNIDATVLMSDIVRFVSKEKVIFEILETVEVTDEIVARVERLVNDGYRFALDDIRSNSENVKRLLPLTEIVKIEITGMERETLAGLSRHFKAANKKLLAEKVETIDEFEYCVDLGFDYFQGYYFAHPFVLSGKSLSPSQLTIVEVMAQVTSGKSAIELENSIKRDTPLSLALLHMVNDPAVGVSQPVGTIGEAVLVMGRRQFHRWLQILLYAEPGAPEKASPLLNLATTRGRLMELMAERIKPGERYTADVAFTVGMLSLTDALLGMPMNRIVERVTIDEDVKEALLSRSGLYGEMLQLAECIEDNKGPQVTGLLENLHLSTAEFKELELAAFQWGDKIAAARLKS
jgi:EAL and modified HD-GYP domain-containing signal transduction protein